jgi:hypothetical protein
MERSSSLDSPELAPIGLFGRPARRTSTERSLVWQPDESSPNCVLCTRAFNPIRRRHHCRACGILICDCCSRRRTLSGQALLQSVVFSNVGSTVVKSKRVCVPCSQSEDLEDLCNLEDWEAEWKTKNKSGGQAKDNKHTVHNGCFPLFLFSSQGLQGHRATRATAKQLICKSATAETKCSNRHRVHSMY